MSHCGDFVSEGGGVEEASAVKSLFLILLAGGSNEV